MRRDGNDGQFRETKATPSRRTDCHARRTDAEDAIVDATTDESDPTAAEYHPATNRHWKYAGKRAVQSRRASDPAEQLEAMVNGRRVYWASQAPIPGDVSFENFELKEPFKQGREFVFAVEPAAE